MTSYWRPELKPIHHTILSSKFLSSSPTGPCFKTSSLDHSSISDTTASTVHENSHVTGWRQAFPANQYSQRIAWGFSVSPTWVVRLACFFALGIHSAYFPLHFSLSLVKFFLSPPLRSGCQVKAIPPSLLCCLNPRVFRLVLLTYRFPHKYQK